MNPIHAAHIATEFPAVIGRGVAHVLAVIGRGVAHVLVAILGFSQTAARSEPSPISLVRGQTRWVDRPLGHVVVCEEGQLWLTFDNEPQHIVLLPGKSHLYATDARLSVHAMWRATSTYMCRQSGNPSCALRKSATPTPGCRSAA